MPACQYPLIYGYTVSVSTTGSNTLRKYVKQIFSVAIYKARNKFCVATHTH